MPSLNTIRRWLPMLAAILLVACSTSTPISPDPVQHVGQAFDANVWREAPLHWIHDDAWVEDEQNGSLVRTNPCGEQEPDLHSFGIELGADIVPDGATLYEAQLHVIPCPSRVGPDLPDNVPVMALRLIDHFGVEHPFIGSTAQDYVPSLAAYVQPHDMTITMAAGMVMDRSTRRLELLVEPEYGPGARGGFRATGLRLRLHLP